MYRGKTRYQILPNGDLNFDETASIARNDYDKITPLYQEPQRVVQSCGIVPSSAPINDGFIRHDCPTENSVSGSSLVTEIDGQSYLVGLVTRAILANMRSVAEDGVGSSAIASSEFCADYQTACGQPCAQLDDVLGAE